MDEKPSELEQMLKVARPQAWVQERRLVLRVLQRWEHLRAERSFPMTEEIVPSVMGDDWPFCFVLDLESDGGPQFVQVGDALEAGAWSPPVRKLSACPDGTLLRMASEFFPRVIDRRVPISIGAPGQHLGRTILLRAILLPLSHDSEHIDALLGAANFREA